jgi:hypothetical protein
MDWKDIGRSLVSQGVPLLGGLLGGPAGAVAGKLVAGLFGADPENPEEVMNAIQGDPNAMVKLRELENNHKQKLQELQLEETKAFLSDVDSARKREAAVVAATGGKDTNLYVLSYIVVGAFFLLVLILILGEFGIFSSKMVLADAAGKPILDAKGETQYVGINPISDLKENALIMMIVGGLISGFTQVLSYFFGSSKGSSDKNRYLQAKG